MFKLLFFLLILSPFISIGNGARILAVFTAPFYSHQSVFRPITQELARRGHDVVVITTDPTPKDNLHENIKEIDIQNISYKFRNNFPLKVTGRADDIYEQTVGFYKMFRELLQVQINTVQIQKLVNDKDQHFDLILMDAVMRSALVFSHFFKAPVITISTLGSIGLFTKYLGVPEHPILYPTCLHQRLHKLSLWEKAVEVYKHYLLEEIQHESETNENEMLKKNFGDVPSLSELKKNVAMLMINVHHVWEGNRPVPPNVVYLGGLHLKTNVSKELSNELKSYLDSSTHGVIYVSFGSLVVPSLIENVKIIIKAFSKLPYDILLKWDDDYLPGCSSNVKVVKWVPQKELLYHPNIKLFITQGGMQSTDEAITAGVPLIGIPILGDQWYNVEKYVHHKIGLRIDLENVTEKKMLDAINTVINDKSYKNNIIPLRALMYDQPQSSLDRAVWCIEYILRHGRSPHLLAPAAHLSSWDFFEIDLIVALTLIVVTLLIIVLYVGLNLFRTLRNNMKIKFKHD